MARRPPPAENLFRGCRLGAPTAEKLCFMCWLQLNKCQIQKVEPVIIDVNRASINHHVPMTVKSPPTFCTAWCLDDGAVTANLLYCTALGEVSGKASQFCSSFWNPCKAFARQSHRSWFCHVWLHLYFYTFPLRVCALFTATGYEVFVVHYGNFKRMLIVSGCNFNR